MGELELLVRSLFGTSAPLVGPWWILAPHPDDETIGATWILTRAPQLSVIFVTDGAPKNRGLWPASAPVSLEAYAQLRAQEAGRALGLASVAETQIVRLGICDQEASLDLVSLTRALLALCERGAPCVIVSPPYEGGHPDHDATCFAAHCCQQLLLKRDASAPHLMEMTSYHRREGTLCTSRFLDDTSHESLHALSAGERAQKREMLACFASQAEVLAPFGSDQERFRAAPRYDFTRSPHAGSLHYETLSFGWTGVAWRKLASQALDELGLGCAQACPRTRTGDEPT